MSVKVNYSKDSVISVYSVGDVSDHSPWPPMHNDELYKPYFETMQQIYSPDPVKELTIKLRETVNNYDKELESLKKSFELMELKYKAKLCDYLAESILKGEKDDLIDSLSAQADWKADLDKDFNKECLVLQEKYINDIKLLVEELEQLR